MCKLCEETFVTQAEVGRHIDSLHKKEVAHAELEQLKAAIYDSPDLSRQLLLKQAIAKYTLDYLVDEGDYVSSYSLDEALGDVSMHEMWHRVMDCGYAKCTHNEPTPDDVEKALIRFSRKRG